jgi:hypothetical protein
MKSLTEMARIFQQPFDRQAIQQEAIQQAYQKAGR